LLIVNRYLLIACLAFAQANAGGLLRSEASKAGYWLIVIELSDNVINCHPEN